MPMIMNKAPHHRALPPPHLKEGETLKDELDFHVLSPGVNSVGDEEWAEAKKLPAIKALLEDGTLEEILVRGKPARELGQLKDTEAIKLVKETTDLDLLASWRDKASGAVLKAIDSRVDVLKAEPSSKK